MASPTATVDNQGKIVTGHPTQAIPPSADHLVIGHPQMPSPAVEPSPPPVYLHQLFHQSGRGRRFFTYLPDQASLYRLSAAAMVLFVVMTFIIFMFLLILRPHLPHLQIASVTVSPLSIGNTNVSAACNISILVSNPNQKLTVFFETFRVSLHYLSGELLLSDVLVPPFTQPAKSETIVHVHLPINNPSVEKDAVKALKEDMSHGWVSFEVKILTLMRLESEEWGTRTQMVLLHCPDLKLGFSASTESWGLSDPFRECQVAL